MTGDLPMKVAKVRQKSSNVPGLQLADLIAHPSRNEILVEGLYEDVQLAPFATRIVALLREKYYQRDGRIHGYGKKLL